MRICFLSSAHPPRDKRVFDKEAISLAQAGFEVIHLAPGEAEGTHEQGVEIITYRRPQGIVGRLLQIPRLYRLAAKIEADCYHCNEVDSWFVGVLLKLTCRKRLVFDVHETYPNDLAEFHFPRWSHPLVISLIRLLFRLLLPFTDRLIFAKHSIAKDFVGAEAKQVLVQNFTSLAYANLPPSSDEDPSADKSNTVLITAIHLGLISRARGWVQLLDALVRLPPETVHLRIVGTFNDGSQADFEHRVSELGLDHQVTVVNWLPFEQAYRQITASDVGLVLYQPGYHSHTHAFPHKMFDYMLAGLPVIAPAFAEEVAYIIREADCGLLIDPSNPDEIAQALNWLAANPSERQRLGENGRRSVLERYNWEGEAEKLVNMYAEMAHAANPISRVS